MQEELDRLMNSKGNEGRVSYDFNETDEFWNEMQAFYAGDKTHKKHESPTTRLRQLKDSTWEHKAQIRKSKS